MTYQDIVKEVNKLSRAEQFSLLELLVELIRRQDLSPPQQPGDSPARVRGLLKPVPGQPTPTEADLTKDYTDYLLKKYS